MLEKATRATQEQMQFVMIVTIVFTNALLTAFFFLYYNYEMLLCFFTFIPIGCKRRQILMGVEYPSIEMLKTRPFIGTMLGLAAIAMQGTTTARTPTSPITTSLLIKNLLPKKNQTSSKKKKKKKKKISKNHLKKRQRIVQCKEARWKIVCCRYYVLW